MKTIADFKNIQPEELKLLYSKFRDKSFKYLINNFNHSLDERKDIYHDSLLTLYTNIKEDKIKNWNGSLEGYLFGVLKNKSLEYVRRKKKNITLSRNERLVELINPDENQITTPNEERMQLVSQALNLIKDPCNTLLKLFYLENKSYEEICLIMGYNNTDTAKSKKSKCLKRLRKLVNDHIDTGSIRKS